MRWSYKTVHFSMKKDGLLGSAFLDESEIEISLNEYGKAGWELVSFAEVSDGLIGVFKQPFSRGVALLEEDRFEDEELQDDAIQDEELPPIEEYSTRTSDFPPQHTSTLYSEDEGLSDQGMYGEDNDDNREDDDTDVGSIRIA